MWWLVYFACSGNNGDVVMYQWVEWLREYINNKSEEIRGKSVSEWLDLCI